MTGAGGTPHGHRRDTRRLIRTRAGDQGVSMMQLDVGSQLGSYRIEGYIGRGGMGVVYRAEHAHLGRQVALKLLAPELAENQSFRERFVRESRVAARVDHPNVIPIYEAGEAAGQYFIAMRFVDGLDLRDILHSNGPLDLTRALSVLTQVAGALDAAHAQGLVHRDVKPGNILVGAESEHCYLTDFGLTKAISSDTAFTATGQFVGTTDYVAPEQIEGKELDRRTDVYSLGCVFYECLAGVTPFHRETDMAVMWAHIQEPPPRLSERRPDLPKHLDDVIATAMAKSKDDRYPSCSTFAAAARSALEMGTGRSFAAVPAPVPQPAAAAAPPPRTEPPGPAAPNVWQGPPEVGYAPVWAPPPPPNEGGTSLTAIALIIAALLLAGGGTAAALIVTHKDKSPKTAAAVTPTGTQTTTSNTTLQGPTSSTEGPPVKTPSTDTTTTPSTPAPDGAAAEKTIKDHFTALENHDYQTAYSFLDTSVALPFDRWEAARKRDGLQHVTFNDVTATPVDSNTATVSADFDTEQTSCPSQNFSGTFTLVNSGGEWLIHSRDLQVTPPC